MENPRVITDSATTRIICLLILSTECKFVPKNPDTAKWNSKETTSFITMIPIRN